MLFIFTVDHLKRLTREVSIIKYDMRQTLTLLDILIKRTNTETEAKNIEISFEGIENRFPLQTTEQLMGELLREIYYYILKTKFIVIFFFYLF